MAIFKWIGAIHPDMNGENKFSHVKNLLNYIVNPQKTDSCIYVGSNLCFPDADSAYEQFIRTDEVFGKMPTKIKDRLAYHACISFKKNDEDVNKDKAFDIVSKFVAEYLPGYECVFSVHDDKEHLHCHIAFNSVSTVTGRKFNYSDNDWERVIMPILDKLCTQHGIHTLEEDTNTTYGEMKSDRKSRSNKTFHSNKRNGNNKYYKEENDKYANRKDMIRYDIDKLINESVSFNDFLKKLSDEGYVFRMGKTNNERFTDTEYLALKCQGMDKYRRTYALGRDYTVSSIKRRIAHKEKEKYDRSDFEPYSDPDFEYIFYKTRLYGFKVHYESIKLNTPVSNVYRKHYRYMYQCGIKPKHFQLDYKETNERVKAIKSTINRLNLLEDYCFTSSDSVSRVIDEKKTRLTFINSDIENINEQLKKYRKIKNSFKKLDELSVKHELYLKGFTEYEEYSVLYEKLLSSVRSFDISEDECSIAIDKLYSQRKALNMEKKSVIKEMQDFDILRGEFDEAARVHSFGDVDINILNDIDSSYSFSDSGIRRK